MENKRKRFELGRDKTSFALELIAVATMIGAAIILAASGQSALALVPLMGSTGLGGLIGLLHQRSSRGR